MKNHERILKLTAVSMFEKIYYAFEYFKYLKNPISCLLFKFGFKKSVTVRLKNNLELDLNEIKLLDHFMSTLKLVTNNKIGGYVDYFSNVDFDSKTVIVNGIEIINPTKCPLNSVFHEYFFDYYDDFDINYDGKVIIDIGSHAGDSALFFASKGAVIYGFEPVKELYNLSLKNIKLNLELSPNINIFNLGVSYKKGKIKIDSMDSVSSYINERSQYDVEILDINDIINKFHPNLLKMDCEGCEFSIILNSDLSKFDEIIFEQHAKMVGKDFELLEKRLKEQGFNIKVHTVYDEQINDLALVYAYK